MIVYQADKAEFLLDYDDRDIEESPTVLDARTHRGVFTGMKPRPK